MRKNKNTGGEIHVTKIMPSDQDYKLAPHKYTHEQLQQEFNYMQAEKVTKQLLEKGFITEEEFKLIMAENKRTFPTFLSPLL